MKKIIIISFLISILSFDTYSQRYMSSLTVKIWNNSFFTAKIGNNFFKTPTNKLKMNKLEPGRYEIEIYQKSFNYYGTNNQLVYKGIVDIPNSSHVVAKLDRFKALKLIIKNKTVHTGKNDFNFKKLKHKIRSLYSDNDKLRKAKNAIKKHNFNSYQIYEIMLLFYSDNVRLKFAKYAYDYCTDTEKYNVVNSALTRRSIRELRLYLSNNNNDYNNFNIKTLKQKIRHKTSDKDKLITAKNEITSHKLSSNTIYEIAMLFGFESTRLEFIKDAYNNCNDKHNYKIMYNAFENNRNINDLKSFINSKNNYNKPSNFYSLKQKINSEYDEQNKLAIAKNWITTKKLAATQIYELLMLFSYETTRLDFAKYAYDYCSDTDNYSYLNKAFSNSRNINELNNYISAKHIKPQKFNIENLKNRIKRKSSDVDKLTLAKNEINSQKISSNDVYEILLLFNKDEYKFEFAKYAYNFCYDKKRYYIVKDAFSNQEYKDNFNVFMNGGKTKNNVNIEQVKEQIKIISFESDKLKTAKTIASTSKISSSDIYEIMKLFSFESTKLNYAKYAYDYCIDKQSYHIVNKGFTFNNSKIELNNYILRKR